MLANFGAEVIKIEDPQGGDYARTMQPLIGQVGAYFLFTNAGKKSLAINLKDERGKNALLRLVARADVLIENFRPGVMQRLGLNYERLCEKNERLIYVALTGYGQNGPDAARAGHDINYLSLGGVLDGIRSADGVPVIPGIQIADLAGGSMPAVIGTLLALAARAKTGKGQLVDVSMFDGLLTLLHIPLADYFATGRHGGELLTGRYACYQVYEARDGRWLSVGALEPKFWETLCRVLGCQHLISYQYADDARQVASIRELAAIFRTRDAREWAAMFEEQDACVSMIKNIGELTQDAHVKARQMLRGVSLPVEWGGGGIQQVGVAPKLSETPGAVGGVAPLLGQHSRELLLRFGLSPTEVNELERARVVRVGES
jgi:crotonobetainyl-CoA:carnitine CoA-transferase CaiB-like acyl-CoA transferase